VKYAKTTTVSGLLKQSSNFNDFYNKILFKVLQNKGM